MGRTSWPPIIGLCPSRICFLQLFFITKPPVLRNRPSCGQFSPTSDHLRFIELITWDKFITVLHFRADFGAIYFELPSSCQCFQVCGTVGPLTRVD